MGRDHRKLRAFVLADRLVTDVYLVSRQFPSSERFGVQMQLLKAAVSAATNIVEGSARRTTRAYLSFLNIAAGSAAEAAYLATLAGRLGFMGSAESQRVATSYGQLVGLLQALMNSLNNEP